MPQAAAMQLYLVMRKSPTDVPTEEYMLEQPPFVMEKV